ncbi:MAG: CPBP family intramembrane metalloprotease [Verrucomicrobia bacterium]|nr:CPBP family intramembrane metalloprotease [Verrucomicrobiota bacterium]
MQEYVEYLQVILLFGLLGSILVWVAKSNGYFHLPHPREKRFNPVPFKTVLAVFVIYLGMTMVVAPILARIIQSAFAPDSIVSALGWLQLLLLASIFILFYLYCNAQDPGMFKKIWKDRSIPHTKPIGTDILMGFISWIIAFPLVIAMGQLADMILYFFFGFENYEQVAVRYLKTTLGSPSMLAVALFTILIAAPVIEEFLFRGCLQTFFKRHMHPRNAIVLSALCFALFHFAPSQGIGNISLVASLFVFALFLGFIYERQASLFASIGLHMTFNAVSTFRILFFPE